VLDGTGGGNGLEAAVKRIGEEVLSSLKRCRYTADVVYEAGRRLY
jgi:hypothetical protein